MTDLHNKIRVIVESVKKEPTIVNPVSKFVVVTYWWGHNNVNNNIARPCISFYEDYINRLINFPNVDYAIANPYYKNTHEKFLFDVIRQNSNKFLQIYGKNDDNVRVFKIIK